MKCEDCEYYKKVRGDMTKKEAKSCIGTIELLRRLAYNIHGVMDVIDADNCEKIIKALEQEPKTGHWINHQDGRWIYAKCSECETVHDTQTNYCPNCGARMQIEGVSE